jgi:hypothetical protein
MAETKLSRRDLILGVSAAFGLVIAVAKWADGTFDAFFWGAIAVVAAGILFATQKEVVMCGALLFLCVRFMFAFAISLNPYALLGALVSGGAAIAFGTSSRPAGDL